MAIRESKPFAAVHRVEEPRRGGLDGGIIAVTRFMLNARAAGACGAWRVSGSSRLTMLGWGLCPPASRICWASPMIGTSGAWATAAEYVFKGLRRPGPRRRGWVTT